MASAFFSLLLYPTQALLYNCQYVCLGLCLHDPQLALARYRCFTLVGSALITSKIPASSFPRKRRHGRADSLVPFWGPGCMCVGRAVGTSVCPRNSPTWSFLRLAAYVLVARSFSKEDLGSSFGAIWIGNLRAFGILECVLEVPSESLACRQE